jgi:hypothetical protein
MGISLETLQRFVAGGMAAQRAVDRSLAEHPQRLGAIVGFLGDPHQLLRRLPVKVAGTYRYCDARDAMVTLARLKSCGSIVQAVRLEIAAEQLRERAGR